MFAIDNSFILFFFWCLLGWGVIFLRNTETKLSFIILESAGYHKTSSVLGVLVIVFWPFHVWIMLKVGGYILKHAQRKKDNREYRN